MPADQPRAGQLPEQVLANLAPSDGADAADGGESSATAPAKEESAE
ncbi:NAD(P)H-quinone oxidoreductase chain I [Synechococcus sp. WH 8101]|nr:NAD(P)H-quinone oxidoreductase chain I [Synechococcus sp. WH 8101]QNI46454.1 NADH dehydrogenase I subunit NdhI [Synechococcus sp. WH 8101]